MLRSGYMHICFKNLFEEMGTHRFSITMNHPFNAYTVGQSVRGKVHLTLHAPQSVRGVYVRFQGIAKVKWTEMTESRKRTLHCKRRGNHITYHGEHEYFNKKIYLIGEANGASFELQPGIYNYKFEYNLLLCLPSSYEGICGGVFYNVSAGLDRHWAFDNEEPIKLQIRSPIDLNTAPHLKIPGHVTCTKHICCLLCQSGPLTIEIDIPKTGYTKGEVIHIMANIENLTICFVTMLEFKLKQITLFHSKLPHHHTKSIDDILCSIQVEARVADRSTRTYDLQLQIPEHDVLNFNNCDLLDVQYELQMEAYIDGFHKNLSDRIPIKMGTIPITVDSSPMEPPSILVGYGTPYPYETEQLNTCQNACIQPITSYGWMLGAQESGNFKVT